jgi:hypothetical protein
MPAGLQPLVIAAREGVVPGLEDPNDPELPPNLPLELRHGLLQRLTALGLREGTERQRVRLLGAGCRWH